MFHTLTTDARARCLEEIRRVLRPGGRIVVFESATRARLGGLIGRRGPDDPYEAAGSAMASLEAGGYAGVRVLAEREGLRFIEGAKRA